MMQPVVTNLVPVMDLAATTRNDFENEKVREGLRQNGDDCRTPRLVDHYAYFGDIASLRNYREYVESNGYQIIRESSDDEEDSLWLLLFSKLQRLTELDPITSELQAKAESLDGEYDGWECDVVRRRQ
jgi:hypothetical protein